MTTLASSSDAFALIKQTAFPKALSYDSIQRELDEVERKEPHYIPRPNDFDPIARDMLDAGETPVNFAGNYGRSELRDAEGAHERPRGTFQ